MRLQFNELPRPLRERFVAATHRGDPLLLASVAESDSTGTYVVMLAIFTVGLLVLASLVLRHVGLMQPAFVLGLFAVGACGFTLAATLLSRKRYPLPPYRMGTFVFGPWIVTAGWGHLDLAPVADVVRTQTIHYTRNGSYTGSRVTLYAADGRALGVLGYPDQQKAAQGIEAIEQMKIRYVAATQARDAAAAAAIDPFFALGAPQPMAPGDGPAVVARPSSYLAGVWGAGVGASLVVTILCGSIGSCVGSSRLSSEIGGRVAAKKGASKDKYDAALSMFKAQAASGAASKFMAAAFEKMIDTGNPAMLVRIRMPSASALAKVDGDLPRGAVPVGPTYEKAMERKKPDVVTSLGVALSKALPYQAPGEPLLMVSEATTDGVLGDQPRIEIEIEARAARDAYKSAGHAKPYGGVSTRFHVVASVPGSSDKLTADIDVPPPPADHVAKHYESSNDLYVQGSLHGFAWEQLTPKLKALFVK